MKTSQFQATIPWKPTSLTPFVGQPCHLGTSSRLPSFQFLILRVQEGNSNQAEYSTRTVVADLVARVPSPRIFTSHIYLLDIRSRLDTTENLVLPAFFERSLADTVRASAHRLRRRKFASLEKPSFIEE